MEKKDGRGRPRMGITRKVSLTLTKEQWAKIEQQQNISEYLRELVKKEDKNV